MPSSSYLAAVGRGKQKKDKKKLEKGAKASAAATNTTNTTPSPQSFVPRISDIVAEAKRNRTYSRMSSLSSSSASAPSPASTEASTEKKTVSDDANAPVDATKNEHESAKEVKKKGDDADDADDEDQGKTLERWDAVRTSHRSLNKIKPVRRRSDPSDRHSRLTSTSCDQ